MSTKINVRSPFYLNLTEPSAPTPLFTCEVANIQNLTIDQQGQISTPNLDYGTVLSITSTDPDFSNDKFATESVATSRSITVRVSIPAGFSNADVGFLDCTKTVTQPAYVSGVSCSGGPTTNGSISAQTIDVDGDSVTINLSSYFTAGSDPIAGYTVYNANTALVSASVTGSNITITSNGIGGTTNIQVSAYDNGSNTCTATQSISVTVNAPSTAFDCTAANLTGGSIAQDGTIVNPNTHATITAIKATSGGSTITSYSANNTGSDRSVTLYFDLTAPAGYSNAGSTVECSHSFTQPAGDPTFTCEIANLSGQQISSKGVINIGTLQFGTISNFSPNYFAEVSVDTARTVTFTVTIPSGYSNSGTINCVKTLTQPAAVPVCGSNTYFRSAPMSVPQNACTDIWSVSVEMKSTASSVTTGLGDTICQNNAPFNGNDFYYAISPSKTNVGKGTGKFYLWKINSEGVVMDVVLINCPTDGSDGGTGNVGYL
jgi:hypothetical protein